MNRKFKRTTFIWNRNVLQHYKSIYCHFDQFNVPLLNKKYIYIFKNTSLINFQKYTSKTHETTLLMESLTNHTHIVMKEAFLVNLIKNGHFQMKWSACYKDVFPWRLRHLKNCITLFWFVMIALLNSEWMQYCFSNTVRFFFLRITTIIWN